MEKLTIHFKFNTQKLLSNKHVALLRTIERDLNAQTKGDIVFEIQQILIMHLVA